MTNAFVDEIMKTLPPPQPISYPPVDWQIAETVFGIHFPADFKILVNAYGSCQWCDLFRLIRPDTESKESCAATRGEVIEFLEAIFDGNIYNHDGDVMELKKYPDTGGVLPCIGDSNGDYFCWITEGNPEKWTVARFSMGVFTPFDCGIGELIYTWMAQRSPGKDAWSSDFLKSGMLRIDC